MKLVATPNFVILILVICCGRVQAQSDCQYNGCRVYLGNVTNSTTDRLAFNYGDLEVAGHTLIRLNVYGIQSLQWSLLLPTTKSSFSGASAGDQVFVCSNDDVFSMYQVSTQAQILEFTVAKSTSPSTCLSLIQFALAANLLN